MSKVGCWSRFIDNYTEASTIRNYSRYVREFLRYLYREEWEPHLDGIKNLRARARKELELAEEYADRYFEEDRDYEDDIRSFFKSKLDIAPISYKIVGTAIKSFLMWNDVELKELFWRRMRQMKKGSKAITVDRVPKPKQLRRIIQHIPIHGKALFLTLASSGMRLGEVLQMELDDINLDADPVSIDIRAEYTKNGNRRWTFISDEAKEAIVDWLSQRENYIKTAVKKSTLSKKSLEDNRIFPFSTTVVYSMWRKGLDSTGLNSRDKTTKIHKYHVHVLRKFFRTYHRADKDIREVLMGHEGYLTEEYRDYSYEQLAEAYKLGVSGVLIFWEAGEIDRLKQKVEEQNEALQTMVQNLTLENAELKNKVRELDVSVAKTSQVIGEVVLPFIERVFKESEDVHADFLEVVEIAKEELKDKGEEK